MKTCDMLKMVKIDLLILYSIVLCEYCIINCFSVITCLEALICIKYGLDMFKKTEIVSIILWLLVQVFTFD